MLTPCGISQIVRDTCGLHSVCDNRTEGIVSRQAAHEVERWIRMTLVNGQSKPTLVDLFCGAGGLSRGFQDAGFEVIHAVDNWQPAVSTYVANNGHRAVCDSIATSIELPFANVYAGGPPCQGFSSAGHRRTDDERNSLVAEFAEIIATNRPDAFVFENVEGFLTNSGGRFVIELLERVIEAGYCVHIRKINAANFGVPQHRKRVIAIGGLGWAPDFPSSTHSAFGAPGAALANEIDMPQAVTVEEALLELPEPLAKRHTDGNDHFIVPLDGDDLKRAQLLKPGQSMRDLPEELWHQSYRRRANRRVKDGTPTERRGGPPAGLRRLRPDEPSKAITGGSLRDFLHPYENRALTLRECATLQSFPSDYKFTGSQADIIQQIGNAVPPRLARSIAASLKSNLQIEPRTIRPNGCLLSFVPTLSNGMSPALETVVNRVRKMFTVREAAYVQRQLWD